MGDQQYKSPWERMLSLLEEVVVALIAYQTQTVEGEVHNQMQ